MCYNKQQLCIYRCVNSYCKLDYHLLVLVEIYIVAITLKLIIISLRIIVSFFYYCLQTSINYQTTVELLKMRICCIIAHENNFHEYLIDQLRGHRTAFDNDKNLNCIVHMSIPFSNYFPVQHLYVKCYAIGKFLNNLLFYYQLQKCVIVVSCDFFWEKQIKVKW